MIVEDRNVAKFYKVIILYKYGAGRELGYLLALRLANFFSKRSGNKYFRFCGHMVSVAYGFGAKADLDNK